MADTNTVSKYIKVRALALEGSPGERETAARILEKMESDYPGIQHQADEATKEPEHDANSDGFPFGGNWEEIFNVARGVVNSAYDFANTMAAAYVGRQLASRYVEPKTSATSAGNVVIGLKMPLAVYYEAQQLNASQKHAFRQVLHEMLAHELDEMLDEIDQS